jgi:hypothetical protein
MKLGYVDGKNGCFMTANRYPFSCDGLSWYAVVVKLVHIQRNRISADRKCMEHYHV